MNSLSHSMLDFFGKVPFLDPILWSNEQQIFSTNSLNESSIEFQLETDRNIFTDLRSTRLFIRGRVIKGDRTRLDNAEETLLVNNALHSLFSNCEVYLNNEQVHSANSLYAHQAFVSAEFSGTKGTKESLSQCQGYRYEIEPNDFTKRAFTDTVFQKDKDEFTFYGPLAIGLFACETLLLPNVNLRLKLIWSSPAFYMIDTGGLNSEAIILEACLFTRQVAISDNWMRSFKSRLLREPAIFYYNEELPKTFIFPAGQNQFIQENIFSNKPIRMIDIAMNLNNEFSGTHNMNPFHFRKFGLRLVKIVRGNQTIVNLRTENHVRAYAETMKALKFDDDGPNIQYKDFENHFHLFFDLTSTQEANVEMHFPDVVGAGVRLELYFANNLTNTVELFVSGERISSIAIDKEGSVTKNG